MAESTDRDNLPQATVVPKQRTRISVVWIIPILAAVVAIGIAVQRILSEGPTITIVFKAAQGIEAGKTFIKYKDVNIGQVTAVELADDFTRVEVTAKIAKSAAGLMVEDAKFWVVEPRITLSGVSGLQHAALGQLHRLRGRQVEQAAAQIHRPRRAARRHRPARPAVRAARRPTSARWASARRSTTAACRSARSSPTTSRPTARRSSIKVFVNAPYDKYVTPETRFWNASGIDVSVGADGVNVRTESLVALLAGGLAFDTPPSCRPPSPRPPTRRSRSTATGPPR